MNETQEGDVEADQNGECQGRRKLILICKWG